MNNDIIAPPSKPEFPIFTLKEYEEHNRVRETVHITNPMPFTARVDVLIGMQPHFRMDRGERITWETPIARTVRVEPGATLEIPKELLRAFVDIQCYHCHPQKPGQLWRCDKEHDGVVKAGGAPWMQVRGRRLQVDQSLLPEDSTQKVTAPPKAKKNG